MTHHLNGCWCLMSHDKLEDFMRSMGCTPEIMSRMYPILSSTGENGHMEEYFIDMTHKCVRRCTYFNKNLVREYMVPMDTECPGMSLNGKYMKFRVKTDGMDKVIRTETGDGYTLTAIAEVNGDMCNTTWTCGGVTCTLKFKRCHL